MLVDIAMILLSKYIPNFEEYQILMPSCLNFKLAFSCPFFNISPVKILGHEWHKQPEKRIKVVAAHCGVSFLFVFVFC